MFRFRYFSDRKKPSAMVHVITKRTTRKRFSAIVDRATRSARKRTRRAKTADFSDLVGTAPLHMDPVKFQRLLRDEE